MPLFSPTHVFIQKVGVYNLASYWRFDFTIAAGGTYTGPVFQTDFFNARAPIINPAISDACFLGHLEVYAMICTVASSVTCQRQINFSPGVGPWYNFGGPITCNIGTVATPANVTTLFDWPSDVLGRYHFTNNDGVNQATMSVNVTLRSN